VTRCIALSGGVGGAKLALGLSKVLSPEDLLIVANTGDDFEHLGLTICPDIDTLLYTLGGIANPETGWGRAGESWQAMETLEQLGGETWFSLGDKDLALHLMRSHRLQRGESLSAVVDDAAEAFDIGHRIVPMSDLPVRTSVYTDRGRLPFQEYFVKHRCEPAVTGFAFEGADRAEPHPALVEALAEPGLEAIIVCPSNPFISIDPILHLSGLRDRLGTCPAPIIAVSPIIGGKALKGPAAKMLAELGHSCDAAAIADHYGPLLQGFVIDAADAALAPQLETPARRIRVAETVMTSLQDRIDLAETVLAFAHEIAGAAAS
jgi:LPPG:FO 2-phospho-L-lactate transferase